MSKPVLTYPAWHDEARAMRFEKGKTISEIAEVFHYTPNRMSQVVSPNWKAYYVAVSIKMPTKEAPWKTATVGDSVSKIDQYEYVPNPDSPDPRVKREKKKPFVKPGEEFMPSIRDFKPLKKYEGGKVIAGAQIECSVCHKEATYFKSNGSVNPVYLPKEFERMGWTVGKTARGDLCPEHSVVHTPMTEQEKKPVAILETKAPIKSFDALGGTALQRGTDINTRYIESLPGAPAQRDTVFVTRDNIPKTVSVVHVPKLEQTPPQPTGIQSLAPAPMDKITHRLIFAKLNEVYLDEKTGYAGEWNDAKVALDLGIDAAHVAEVRSSFFGPETNASLMRAAIDSIIKAGEAIERRVVLIDKKIEQMQVLDDKVETSRKEVEAAIERFEQLVANLSTQDLNMQGLINDFGTEVSGFKKMFAELKQ